MHEFIIGEGPGLFIICRTNNNFRVGVHTVSQISEAKTIEDSPEEKLERMRESERGVGGGRGEGVVGGKRKMREESVQART